jgi:hypothetical protein
VNDPSRRCSVCGRPAAEDNPLTTFHVTYTNGRDIDVCPHCILTAVQLLEDTLGERWWEHSAPG